MKFLIIGHPKCGSKYMSVLMYEFGFELGHEEEKKNGIVCWENVNILHQFKETWGPHRTIEMNYDYIIHYVRNPYDSISSIIVENKVDESYQFRRQIIKHHFGIDLNDYDEYNAAALSYIYYNRLAESQGPHLRVQVENSIEQIANFLGVKIPICNIPTNINTNGSKKQPFRVAKLKPNIKKMLDDTAKRYGYLINF